MPAGVTFKFHLDENFAAQVAAFTINEDWVWRSMPAGVAYSFDEAHFFAGELWSVSDAYRAEGGGGLFFNQSWNEPMMTAASSDWAAAFSTSKHNYAFASSPNTERVYSFHVAP